MPDLILRPNNLAKDQIGIMGLAASLPRLLRADRIRDDRQGVRRHGQGDHQSRVRILAIRRSGRTARPDAKENV